MEERKAHWEGVYAERAPDEVSWYQAEPRESLRLIETAGLGAGSAALDLGSGASVLIDRLLERGFRVSALDLSAKALQASQTRLGAKAAQVDWLVADVRTWQPQGRWDLWHDRAVFHFLTEPEERAGYLKAMKAALEPGGWILLATFSPEGPERCSGLPVQRWDAAGLAVELGPDFELKDSSRELHKTPWDSTQAFQYSLFRRRA